MRNKSSECLWKTRSFVNVFFYENFSRHVEQVFFVIIFLLFCLSLFCVIIFVLSFLFESKQT